MIKKMHYVLLLTLVSVPLAFAVACSSSDDTNGVGDPGVADPGAPSAPSDLVASQIGGGIHLTWKDNSSDESEFQVERKEGAGTFAKIASVVFDTLQFHDTSVSAGKTYRYRVRAASSSGARSTPTNEVQADAPQAATGEKDAGAEVSTSSGWDGGAVSFAADIVPLFERSCGTTNTGCHVREQYYATSNRACRGWLALENASLGSKGYGGAEDGKPTNCPDRSLYDRLVQLDAWQEPNGQLIKYVTPGDPAKSYLYNKMSGGPVGESSPGVASEQMPPKAPLGALDVAMMKKWIESGAPK